MVNETPSPSPNPNKPVAPDDPKGIEENQAETIVVVDPKDPPPTEAEETLSAEAAALKAEVAAEAIVDVAIHEAQRDIIAERAELSRLSAAVRDATAAEVPNPGIRELEDTDPRVVPVPVGVTRKLTMEDFYGTGQLINESLIIETARDMKIEPEVLIAFTTVESPKGPFMPDGRPWILYEAHVFARNCKPKGKYNESHPNLSSKGWNRSLYGRAGDWQYQRLLKAMQLDQRAALMACSWGAWQVLGENYADLGFKTVEDFVLFNVQSQANQFECFIRELRSKKGLVPALQSKDWPTIAYLYNGSGYRANNYDVKMAKAYEELVSHSLRRGAQGPKVVTLQKLLNLHGANPPVKVDGWFGVGTDTAVRDLQAKWGIVIDGVVGPQTYERLAAQRIDDEPIVTSKRAAAAAVAVGTGTASVAKGVVDLNDNVAAVKSIYTLEQLKELNDTTLATKEVIGTAKNAAEQVVGVQQSASWALILVGIVVLGIAAFIVWTKFVDKKKAQGVE
jgi:hypothetical protein